jgi:choline dehydrogenase-like flavoprotein
MSFHAATYPNFVTENGAARSRLFLEYLGPRDDFDLIIIGSGMGGGILADDLADRAGKRLRILVLEAGSFLYPTHVYNCCRFPNADVARHFGCDTFTQPGDSKTERYIGEKPQLAFGGRSLFWSGLIPAAQPWELDFFPPAVRQDLLNGGLAQAGELMNASRTMGTVAQEIVRHLNASDLGTDFVIEETPRALHQPYLAADGTPRADFHTEPTGVFNTAELLINQLGLTPGLSHGDGPGLHLLLNRYVEDIQTHGSEHVVLARHVPTGQARYFRAPRVVLAAGSIESPKLLRRSSLYSWLPDPVKPLVGRGLTDHPTSGELACEVTHLGALFLPKTAHAKIILYSRGHRDGSRLRFPFNVEINLNHEWWHLRENDPSAPSAPHPTGNTRLDLKFSFGNCLDDGNEIHPAPAFGYRPEIAFRNLSWMSHLAGQRFPALAGWRHDAPEIFAILNGVADRILRQFSLHGARARPFDNVWLGEGGKGFGWGTVHHAVGTLRMPWKAGHDQNFADASVVDEQLHVHGTPGLYVCDMSVMPFSTAANPVRTLAALALRLSRHLA